MCHPPLGLHAISQPWKFLSEFAKMIRPQRCKTDWSIFSLNCVSSLRRCKICLVHMVHGPRLQGDAKRALKSCIYIYIYIYIYIRHRAFRHFWRLWLSCLPWKSRLSHSPSSFSSMNLSLGTSVPHSPQLPGVTWSYPEWLKVPSDPQNHNFVDLKMKCPQNH